MNPVRSTTPMLGTPMPGIGPRTCSVPPLLHPAVLLLAFLLASCSQADSAGPRGEDPKPLQRGTFFVAVEESMEGKKPADNIAVHLIEVRMLHHGFTRAKDASSARYLIDGTIEYTYHKELKFREELLEHQYMAVAVLTLHDRQATPPAAGAEPTDKPPHEEYFDVPDLINGRKEKEASKIDIRRRVSTLLGDQVVGGRLLGNAKIMGLLRTLGDPYEPREFNDIVKALVDEGTPAAPYLVSLLLDDRPVQLTGTYPGLKPEDDGALKYYHIADMALGDILMRHSALSIDSTETYYKKIITGWTWAWEDVQGIPEEYRIKLKDRESSVRAPKEAQHPKKPSTPDPRPTSAPKVGG